MREFDILTLKNHPFLAGMLEKEKQQEAIYEAKREIEQFRLVKYGVNYVLLDYAAWNIRNAFKLEPLHTCLFATRVADFELEECAPYLFEYGNNPEFAEWLIKKEKEGKKILYLHSNLPIDGLRKHLRHFLRILTEGREWLFFRFYDPNVASVIFHNMNDRQLYFFFSGIDYLVYTDCCTGQKQVITPTWEAKVEIDKKEKIVYPTLVFTDEQMAQISQSRQIFIENKVKAAIRRKLKDTPDTDKILDKIIEKSKAFGIKKEQHMLRFAQLAVAYPELTKEPMPARIAIAKLDTRSMDNKLNRVEIYLKSKNQK